MYDPAMTTVSASTARATLPDLLDRVLAGAEVTITRHGAPVAVLISCDALAARRASPAIAAAATLRGRLHDAREQPLIDAPGISPERAEELLAEVRRDRSGR